MTAVICDKPGSLRVVDLPAPESSGSLVRVRIRRVGVCGTDFHILKGLHPYLEYPRVIGHELSGTVEWAADSEMLKAGDDVVINPYLPCGTCRSCLINKPNCCAAIRVLGVHVDGGMCEFVEVPESAVYPTAGLSLTHAAMIEFLAIGAHAVKRGQVRPGDDALVIGAGPIGVGTGLLAERSGANVTFLDVNARRADTAVSLVGSGTSHAVSDDIREILREQTRGDFFDVVFDATGNSTSMQAALNFVAHGGRCVYVSVVNADITFNDPHFHAREISLLGSRNALRSDFERVISLMQRGDVPLDDLNTHSCDLVNVPDAMLEWLDQQDSLVKGIVHIE